MVKIAFALLLSIGSIAEVDSRAMDCRAPKLKRYIDLTYQAFDQSPPASGWRAMKGTGRDQEMADIIRGYVHCRPGLTSDQKATMLFHVGQILADLGQTDRAIENMRRAYDTKLDQTYHWNSFVAGTIAFLSRDLKALQAARDRVKRLEADHPYVETLDRLIQCFGRAYKDVGPECARPAAADEATSGSR